VNVRVVVVVVVTIYSSSVRGSLVLLEKERIRKSTID
jgi:hypothetical protein